MKNLILTSLLWLAIISNAKSQTVYATVADLMAASPTTNAVAIVADPLRGGEFVSKSASGLTIDSGTVFPSASSLVWVRIRNESAAINVRWFGVNGDSTNCVRLVNKILSLFKGKKIYFPTGKYGVDSASIAIPSNTEVFGDGRDSTMFLGLNGNVFPIFENLPDSGVFTTSNKLLSKNITVHDFVVDGSHNLGYSDTALKKGPCGYFNGVAGLHVYNTTWQHGASNCLRITYSTNFIIEYSSFLYANDGGRAWLGEGNGLALLADGNGAKLKDELTGLVDHCYASHNADVGLDSWGMHNVVFSNNKTDSNSQVRDFGAGIALEGGAYGCKIVNNVVVNERENGYGITRSFNTEFINNLAYNVKNIGLVGSVTYNTKIDHFTCIYSGSSGIALNDAGTGQSNASLKITNCKIDYAGYVLDSVGNQDTTTIVNGDGIYIANGYAAIFDNNEVTHCRQSGIELRRMRKTAVAAATTGNITLSGLSTPIDGVTLNTGNIVLVKNQTDSTQNGLYIAATGAWTRADGGLSGYMIGTLIPDDSVTGNRGNWLFADDDVVFGTTKIRYIQTNDTLIRSTITKNRLSYNGEYGLRLETISGAKIIRNEMTNNCQSSTSRSGLYIANGSYNFIENNNLSDNQVTHTQFKAYIEAGTIDNNFYANNDTTGNKNAVSFSQDYVIDFSGKQIFDATNATATGAQTINKPSGSVKIATTASTVVVTNSLVSASSNVFAVLKTDAGANISIRSVVPSAGSFTIYLTGNPTTTATIGFLVIN